MKVKAGDRLRIKQTGEIVTVQAKGTLGTLEYYLKRDKLPFRYDKYDYGDGENCHSHLHLSEFTHLTKLERALQ